METPDLNHITPFWGDAYKHLEYKNEPFNNSIDTHAWLSAGYAPKFTGDMCDMRGILPVWNNYFISYFTRAGWKDIGTSYYRMTSGTILPKHQDTYKRYVELFNLKGREATIVRAIIFLEDWKSGHYLEINNVPFVNWKAGDIAHWRYDTPHLAANMGLDPRYTLQITGHYDY